MIRLRHLLTATLLSCLAFAKAQEVTFSIPGGFYDNPFELTLSCDQRDKVIHYTTNGNTPTANDPVYREPLLLDKHLFSRSNIYTIPNSVDEFWYQPDSVQKCIVIRSAAFDETGNLLGKVTTNTYLIKSLGCNTHGLPVVSLCVDSLSLFDFETGIFIPGATFDPSDPFFSGNYNQTGQDWERLANFEYYEADNNGLNQACGIRTQGSSSRRFPQKGLKIYAREAYGKKRFKYKFFDNLEISSFKHLKLKPFHAGWERMGCQDYICSRLAEGLDLEHTSSRPTVLYLNGEYWGIYYLLEKPDERFLEDHYDLNTESINIVSTWGGGCDYGNSIDFNDLYQWMESIDLSDSTNYLTAKERIDIENFIDYQIFEMFTANLDWPNNNMRCWQETGGKWRWLFFDGDGCLFRPFNEFDPFANATYVGDSWYPSSTQATLFFRKLMENDKFRLQFCARFYQLMLGQFKYEHTFPFYKETYELLSDEIPNQCQRFGNPYSPDDWNLQMEHIDRFLQQRCEEMRKSLQEKYVKVNDRLASIDIYPNPVQNHLFVDIEASDVILVDVQILDVTGRKVTHSSHILRKGCNKIELSFALRAGLYILKVGEKVGKFVVTN